MPESDETTAKVQDYRIYESHDEHIVTLARLRVDFSNVNCWNTMSPKTTMLL
ncbi:MAG: hypothetical protein IPN95_19290 [Bacteroidetes bacterium]|nr:hypothetical protein [Bacteroidota bacterium]